MAIRVLRSLPDPDALGYLVAREWGLELPSPPVLLRSLVNDVYQVGERHVLKVYRHGWRTPDEVAWEVDLARHLAGQGLPVVRVTERPDGAACGILDAPEGLRPMVLFDRAIGARPTTPLPAGLHRAYGRLIAGLHEAGDTFVSSHPRHPRDLARELDEPLAEILPVLDAGDREVALTAAAAARAGLAGTTASWGLCHGDATLDNILIVGDGPELVIYDFDLAGPGWQAIDFPTGSQFWADFATGYTETRPISEADLAAGPFLDIVYLIGNIRFHLVQKPAWRGTEFRGEGWLDSALTELREIAAAV